MIRCILCFLTAVLLAAAQPADQEVVSLVALDRQGQTVLDLKTDELQMLVDGKPQKIASFGRAGSPSKFPTVVLYDLMNTVTGARGNAQQQIVQSLQRVGPTASVYLYLLAAGGELDPIHGLGAEDIAAWPGNVESLLDAALRKVLVLRPASLDPTGPRVKATYTALAALSTTLSRYPGRKSIVWITHGVPLHGTAPDGTAIDYLPTLKKLAATLGQVHIVVYPVDQTMRAGVPFSDTSIDTLQQIASITGGRFYPNDNIDKAITGALSDTAASYLLTYQPSAGKQDGKFHNIRLTCTRPGVRIQARQGYYADR